MAEFKILISLEFLPAEHALLASMQPKQITQAPVLSRKDLVFRVLMIMITLTVFLLAHFLLMRWLLPTGTTPQKSLPAHHGRSCST